MPDWGESEKWKMIACRGRSAILRMSVYEMLHLQEIPVSVTINEAVEIAKKYATQEDAGFINGILGAIADKEEQKAKEAVQ
ncbi:MAG: transcription antitermination protein NusB [Oscillospiraceae bacterium]